MYNYMYKVNSIPSCNSIHYMQNLHIKFYTYPLFLYRKWKYNFVEHVNLKIEKFGKTITCIVYGYAIYFMTKSENIIPGLFRIIYCFSLANFLLQLRNNGFSNIFIFIMLKASRSIYNIIMKYENLYLIIGSTVYLGLLFF